MLSSISDWLWFVFVIHGDEFHPSLEMDASKLCRGKARYEKECQRLTKVRDRAHRLDQRFLRTKRFLAWLRSA